MDIYGKEAVSIDVGLRLKHLRDERGISMRALARNSGLSANALSMIERGLTSPSVSTLNKLAGALEVPVTAFFRSEPDRNTVVHLKAAQRTRVPFNRGLWEGLGGERFAGRIEAFMITLEANASSGPHGMLHTGAEFVFCLRGTVEYEVDGTTYILETGDSLIFAAQLLHKWRNPGSTVANAIIVISSFEEGERPGEFHLASTETNHP
ncbi:MAG TPA: cupin domain-containing protein [Bellilinea sp.]